MMVWWCLFILVTVLLTMTYTQEAIKSEQKEVLLPQGRSWGNFAASSNSWSLGQRIPMTTEYEDYGRRGGKFKMKKRLKKFMMPLLMAYKLKFFTLIPILIGGLLLITTSTGLAGFFFALFAAAMGLKSGGGWSS